jgi:hypothetical protein
LTKRFLNERRIRIPDSNAEIDGGLMPFIRVSCLWFLIRGKIRENPRLVLMVSDPRKSAKIRVP